jgi:hypothetical protein
VPPDVDCGVPELELGALVPDRPLSDLPLLFELPVFELESLEFELDPDGLVVDDEPEFEVPVVWVDPGRPSATAPAATTLAKPTAAVVALSRYLPRSRSAIAWATRRDAELLMSSASHLRLKNQFIVPLRNL